VAFAEFDVDADPALRERYGLRVPVLTDAQGNELDPASLAEIP
jgi:hypothetical protein